MIYGYLMNQMQRTLISETFRNHVQKWKSRSSHGEDNSRVQVYGKFVSGKLQLSNMYGQFCHSFRTFVMVTH